MLRGDNVHAFAASQNLPVITIEELVNYRRHTVSIETHPRFERKPGRGIKSGV